MTVSYTAEVATCRYFGCFLKLLFRWRASIYKLIYCDLLVYLTLFYTLAFIYRFALDERQKFIFENFAQYCHEYMSLIPLSFVLGFYVSLVVKRWWEQYRAIPWPDPIAVYVTCTLRGQDERSRVMRRTVMRYVCLSFTILMTMISPKSKKRFPTIDHLVEAGLLVESERKIFNTLDEEFPKLPKHLLPLVWAASILKRARKEGRIRDDYSFKMIFDKLNDFRNQSLLLTHFDTISIPLVYTQVVTLAVYTYFLSALMGDQWSGTDKAKETGQMNVVSLYFPLFLVLRFIFYMGWLKVAECLINPFGNDDDDFDINWLIDRNLQVSYLIVDEMHHDHPKLIRDQYWDEVWPVELPYPEEGESMREKPPEPSTAKFERKNDGDIDAVDEPISESGSQKSDAFLKWKRPNDFDFTSSESLLHALSNSDLLSSTSTKTTEPTTSKPSDETKSAADPSITEPRAEKTKMATKSPPAATNESSDVLMRSRPGVESSEITTSFQDSKTSRAEDITTADEVDDFEKLREERERERMERQKRKLIKNLNTVVSATNELPLDAAVKASINSLVVSQIALRQQLQVIEHEQEKQQRIKQQQEEARAQAQQQAEAQAQAEAEQHAQLLHQAQDQESMTSLSDFEDESRRSGWARLGMQPFRLDLEDETEQKQDQQRPSGSQTLPPEDANRQSMKGRFGMRSIQAKKRDTPQQQNQQEEQPGTSSPRAPSEEGQSTRRRLKSFMSKKKNTKKEDDTQKKD